MTASLADAPTTSFIDRDVTSAGPAPSSGGTGVALYPGLQPLTAFGTTSGIRAVVQWAEQHEMVTTTPALRPAPPVHGAADEVRTLRDQICSFGLTRQDVARALHVDRRSLSAWVSGEMRPTPERLEVLHLLARLVRTIDAEQPDRVRDTMVAKRGGTAIIDRVVSEGALVLETWRAAIRPEATVILRSTTDRREPIWAAAARAAAEGQLTPPTWERTVRPPATYEMNLEEASAFAEPQTNVRRQGYK